MCPGPDVVAVSILYEAGLEASGSTSDLLWWLAGLELPGGIPSMGKPGSTGGSQPPVYTFCAPW